MFREITNFPVGNNGPWLEPDDVTQEGGPDRSRQCQVLKPLAGQPLRGGWSASTWEFGITASAVWKEVPLLARPSALIRYQLLTSSGHLFSNFQVYCTLLLIKVTMLHSNCLELIPPV